MRTVLSCGTLFKYIFALLVVKKENYYQMEISFLESLSAIHCRFLDAIMLFFTYIGEVGAVWIVCAVVLLCFKKTRKSGMFLAVALILDALLVNVIIKNIVKRPRPFEYSTQLKDYILYLKYKLPTDYSFPSGHSAVSFCATAVLTYFYGKKAIPAIIVSVVIAFSRLYIGVHYPSDVLIGAIIGTAIGICSIILSNVALKKIVERKNRRQ